MAQIDRDRQLKELADDPRPTELGQEEDDADEEDDDPA